MFVILNTLQTATASEYFGHDENLNNNNQVRNYMTKLPDHTAQHLVLLTFVLIAIYLAYKLYLAYTHLQTVVL